MNIARWMAQIGSGDAMGERKKLRLDGDINQPIRRKAVSGYGSYGHKWECECALCRPWLWQVDRKMGSDKSAQPKTAKAYTHTVISSQPAPSKPRKAWSQRGNSGN